jgi:hypothetical protein
LGNTQDVSDANDGILVFKSAKEEDEAVHIPWSELQSLELDSSR